MKKNVIFILICSLFLTESRAQIFDDYFMDSTLRLDYIFAGNSTQQHIYLDEISQLPGWAGRKHFLDSIPLKGNGQITMTDIQTGKVIYRTSFSSLFQEWLSTEEAERVQKSFENVFLVPFPKNEAEIQISISDMKQDLLTIMKHTISPDDILIHKKGYREITPYKYISQNGDSDECINVVIVAEGYNFSEIDNFYNDAKIAYNGIMTHEPFKSMSTSFNFIAVAAASQDSGVSIPGNNIWKNTAVGSHFSTFYSDRYLTTSRIKDLHDLLAGIPYEHIIILANTEEYGGGGIYNSYTLTTAHHPMFAPVVVHEFGHSFGGLADEYFYENDILNDVYPVDIEPWEKNITTLVDFPEKWKDMLTDNTPIPTPENQKDIYSVGVYEGGGYSAKKIFRPDFNCRMRSNESPIFCPVCQRELKRLIQFYTY